MTRLPLIALFLALLATPLAVGWWQGRQAAAPADTTAAPALARHGVVFTEVAAVSGITFRHTAPTLDAKLAHIMPQVTSMGAAVAVVDVDADGWMDLYVTNSGEDSLNALYRNRKDGTFEDVAASFGVADVNRRDTGVSMGSVWGDYDNDGYPDLFLYKWGRPELFHNDAGRGFTRVSERAGLPAWVNANTALWLDYDRDGRLDLFLGGYYDESVNLWQLATTRMMPESFEYARNGGRKYLFRNLGDGRFEEVSRALGIDSRRWALAVGAADLHGTGYPDLFIANDYGVSELFANHAGRRFVDAGERTGVGFAPKSGMNVAFGDVLNAGRFGIYVTNISEEGVLIQGNNLWYPREGTAGDDLAYDNMAGAMGVELAGWAFGAQFGDFNNDGTLDLFATNGYVSAAPGTDYWYDFSRIAIGHSTIIQDAAHWPAMRGRSLSGYQPKRVWLNDGSGRFTDVARAVGVTETFDGRAVAVADLWNRGVLDVVVAHQRGPLLVYKGAVRPEHQWVSFALQGTTSNRGAVGATVRLFWNGRQQLQQVSGGSGYCAQNDPRLHFGLGPDARIERAIIRWPSGVEQTLEAPAAGRHHVIVEPGT